MPHIPILLCIRYASFPNLVMLEVASEKERKEEERKEKAAKTETMMAMETVPRSYHKRRHMFHLLSS
jgi:hypothetical protein